MNQGSTERARVIWFLLPEVELALWGSMLTAAFKANFIYSAGRVCTTLDQM